MNSSESPLTTRREFLKTSSTMAIASAIAAPHILSSARAASPGDTLKVGLIGCGGRGTGAAAQAMKADSNVELFAVGDVFEKRPRVPSRPSPRKRAEDHAVSIAGTDGIANQPSRIFTQTRGSKSGQRRLGMRVCVTRHDLAADEVFDERQGAPRGRVVGIGDPPRPKGTVQYLVVSNDGGGDRVDQTFGLGFHETVYLSRIVAPGTSTAARVRSITWTDRSEPRRSHALSHASQVRAPTVARKGYDGRPP